MILNYFYPGRGSWSAYELSTPFRAVDSVNLYPVELRNRTTVLLLLEIRKRMVSQLFRRSSGSRIHVEKVT